MMSVARVNELNLRCALQRPVSGSELASATGSRSWERTGRRKMAAPMPTAAQHTSTRTNICPPGVTGPLSRDLRSEMREDAVGLQESLRDWRRSGGRPADYR